MNIIKSCVLCVMLIMLSGYLQINASSFSGAATFVAGSATALYLLEEQYEGVGIPSGHSYVDSSGTNKVDWDDTTPTMESSESAYYPDPGGSGQNKVQIEPGADADEMWVSMMVNLADTPSSTSTFLRWSDTLDSDVVVATLDGANNLNISTNSGGSASADVCTFTIATNYYIKLRAKKGTGANAEAEIWCTSGTSSWGTSKTTTDGTWTSQLDYVELNNYYGHNNDYNIDHLIIDNADIPITAYQ